ncbi:MAG: xanthine dehydrogenase family protein molybdopterin-binding subunit, partial [Alphaproteobacteria bacterium]|nr:xanthine dehydrogenase family protein molybdopterin-binding subunit [Alphaproteobacteria bacterium]
MNEITNRDKNNFKWVGKNTQRPDGPDKVTGRARYGDDMIVPGMLHGKTLRSPHAHAKIISIDTSEAEALSGVKAVVTYKDIPDHPLLAPPYGPMITDFHDISRNIMARDKVFYDGHPVAAVAATSERIAKAALSLIRVEYEILPHVLDPFEAAGADAPILHDYQYTLGSDPKSSKPSNVFRVASSERGDLSKGFAEAEIIVEREFRSQPVHQGYIEPQALVATAAADGSVDLWTTTQGHFVIRGYCARLLNMDMSSIRVTASEIGGGFGGKNNLYSEPVAIRLSQKTGRPVRFVMTRSEVFRATGPASGTYSHLRIGAKKDGTIVAAEATIYNQAGAFKGSPVGRSVDTFFSAYSIKNAKATAYDVCVNRPKVAAYRAPGAPMAALGAELAINELAAKLAIDPIEIRLKNAVQDHEQSLSGVKFGRIGLNEVLVKAREHPHYSAALAENQGRGFALGYWMHGGGLSSVNANLLDDGTVTIATGNPDIGGSRSSMRVMAAEELGVDISLIKTIIADTASIGYSHLTAGSRTTFATGLAVINSVREIIDKLRQLAATKWDVSVENVAWEAGQAVCHHGDFQALSLKQLASLAPKVGGAIAGHSEINATGAGAAFSAHIVDVEVDKETGFTTPKRYTIIQDAGRAISPDYVEGQMQGAAVQGIGWALNEEYIYDHNGCLQNAGFLDYRMPVASDVPMIDTVIVE